MKKSIWLVSIILAFSACKKDNSNTSLTGKWNFSADTLSTSINGSVLTVSNINAFSAGAYLQFNSDASGQNQYSSSYNPEFTYTKAGNHLFIAYPARTVIIDRATYNYPAHTDTLIIKTLTKSNLTLIADQTTVSNKIAQRVYEVLYLSR